MQQSPLSESSFQVDSYKLGYFQILVILQKILDVLKSLHGCYFLLSSCHFFKLFPSLLASGLVRNEVSKITPCLEKLRKALRGLEVL